jgi:intracellular multiplication protein IcmD
MNAAQVASTVTANFGGLVKLITAVGYIAGVLFAFGAIMQFKAHKENPSQVPLGKPVTQLAVAIGLFALPSIVGVTAETIFGGNQNTGGTSGIVISGN